MKTKPIRIIGFGGFGCSIITRLSRSADRPECAMLLAADTDVKALEEVEADEKIQLGEIVVTGYSTFGDRHRGRFAYLESFRRMNFEMKGAQALILTAGFGGGAGTGAIAAAAEEAKRLGIPALCIVTVPMEQDGNHTSTKVSKGLSELSDQADIILIIPSKPQARIASGEPMAREQYDKMNETAYHAIQAAARIFSCDKKTVDPTTLKIALGGFGELRIRGDQGIHSV